VKYPRPLFAPVISAVLPERFGILDVSQLEILGLEIVAVI